MSIIGSQSFYLSLYSNLTYICIYKTSNRIKSTINKTRRSIFFFEAELLEQPPSPVYLRIIDTGSRIKHWRGRKKWITNKAMKRPVNICPFAIAFRYPDNEYVFSPRVCPIHPPFQTYSSRLLSKITGAVAHSNIEMIPGETMYISFRATPLPSRAPPSTKILI